MRSFRPGATSAALAEAAACGSGATCSRPSKGSITSRLHLLLVERGFFSRPDFSSHSQSSLSRVLYHPNQSNQQLQARILRRPRRVLLRLFILRRRLESVSTRSRSLLPSTIFRELANAALEAASI